MNQLILFGTDGCHLCEQAQSLLDTVFIEHSGVCVDLQYVDIAVQECWQDKYATRIPVLLHRETERELAWPFDREQLLCFLEQEWVQPPNN